MLEKLGPIFVLVLAWLFGAFPWLNQFLTLNQG
jgi:hypothetical protein